MRNTWTTRLWGALVVGLMAPLTVTISPAQAGGVTFISFEDMPEVCLGSEAVPLRGRYAAAKFTGPSAKDGAAVFDSCAGWGIAPRTGDRLLAVVTGLALANGGTSRGPVKIAFPVRQKKVTMWFSQTGHGVGDAVFKMVARRDGKTVTSTTTATNTSAWVELTVRHKKGIDAVTLSAPTEPDGTWLMDDLTTVS